jgi:hypothetical protein
MEVNGDPIAPGSLANSVNGADKTDAELAQQSTYTALGWNFSTTWKMEGTRPVLK